MNYVCVILFILILNLFKYGYFNLFLINKKKTKNTAADVGIEPGDACMQKSNAQLFSQLATRYLVEILVNSCTDKNVSLVEFCFTEFC